MPKLERYGIDISPYAIRKARNIRNVKFYVNDIEKKIRFRNNFFDAITAFSVLEHLNKVERTLSEIKRTLKKDGIAFFTFPNTDCLFGRWLFRNDKTHKNNSEKLIKEINKHFYIVKRKYVFYIGNSHDIISSSIPSFLRLECFIIAKPIK